MSSATTSFFTRKLCIPEAVLNHQTFSRIFIKGNALSSDQGKVELKVENVRDVTLDATYEGRIEKDNVDLKLSATSEKLGLKNYKVEISSKDAGAGKRLEFHATNDGKNVFSGR